jgi:hypothetical protein
LCDDFRLRDAAGTAWFARGCAGWCRQAKGIPTSDDKKPQQSLSAQLGTTVGITLAVIGAVLIAPMLYPKAPGEVFSVPQMLCAGALGGIGGALGAGIGALIERRQKND